MPGTATYNRRRCCAVSSAAATCGARSPQMADMSINTETIGRIRTRRVSRFIEGSPNFCRVPRPPHWVGVPMENTPTQGRGRRIHQYTEIFGLSLRELLRAGLLVRGAAHDGPPTVTFVFRAGAFHNNSQ